MHTQALPRFRSDTNSVIMSTGMPRASTKSNSNARRLCDFSSVSTTTRMRVILNKRWHNTRVQAGTPTAAPNCNLVTISHQTGTTMSTLLCHMIVFTKLVKFIIPIQKRISKFQYSMAGSLDVRRAEARIEQIQRNLQLASMGRV